VAERPDPTRVLVVDDDPPLRRMLARTLAAEAYAVTTVGDGGAALAEVSSASPPDMIVLDVTMPGLDGLAVCRRLRAKGVTVPILMLTARDSVADRVSGLESGADDYLVKPFAVEELIARLQALTRRGRDGSQVVTYGDLTIDAASRTATRSGRRIDLTGRELEVLELLAREPRRTITRERAIEEIWSGAAEPNVVDRYVTRLRRKLGAPPLIHTVRGSGFMLRG
jgi:two-component system response regulator MprA